MTHIGRFAPSPSGPLHAGSLIAALGSHVAARAAGGRWHLRIDDLDPPRVVAGAADEIRRALEHHGLEWDGPVVWQSQRTERYAAALEQLAGNGAVYHCTCSRRDIARVAGRGPLGRIYPGTCRHRSLPTERAAAVRVALPDGPIALTDAICGHMELDARNAIGDVVVRRRDGLWAYHLATTIDDADLGVTDVVRGADLLPAALVQVALQRLLALPALRWRHLPLARTRGGAKLSKQTGAAALDVQRPVDNLLQAWQALGQPPPPTRPANAAEFHVWAVANWRARAVPAEPLPPA